MGYVLYFFKYFAISMGLSVTVMTAFCFVQYFFEHFVQQYIKLNKYLIIGFSALLIIGLTFLLPSPIRSYTVGSTFILVGSVMKWLVPRFLFVQVFMQNKLFAGNDIVNQDLLHSEIVGLFRLPLILLGIAVAVPDAMKWVDVGLIASYFVSYGWKRFKVARILRKKIAEALDLQEKVEIEGDSKDAVRLEVKESDKSVAINA